MPRPRSLTNVTSARPTISEDQLLTPRTPHSRSGRAEEAYTEFELQQLSENLDDWRESDGPHQSVPLLSSSASDSFPAHQTTGYRSHGDDDNAGISSWAKSRDGKKKLQMSTLLSNIPLALGSLLAAFLLFLIYVSYNRPEKLHKYLGISPPNSTTSPTSTVPQNNTSTPLDPHLLISYANYTTFPLRPSEYLAECYKLNKGYMSHGDYWQPHEMGVMDVAHPSVEGSEGVCRSTITYMLGEEVGLLADLALLAQAAALARERNRTFFVDDTYWNRGKWLDHFVDVRDTQPGPEPGCSAPLAKELVACPRLARHWVINSRTAKFHLGHSYSEAYEDPYAHSLNRLKPMFKSSKESFSNTIQANVQNTRLMQRARSELLSSTSPDGTSFDSYISLHLRRGDRKPAFYRGEHVPAENFIQAATASWSRLSPGKSPEDLTLFVASDSASALGEIVELTSARYTTYSLFQSADPGLRALASPTDYRQKDFNLLPTSVRIQATRGMIVDFALLSGMWAEENDPTPESIICTFSSNVCKLGAVGFGWDAAFGNVNSLGGIDNERKRWIEIDQNGAIIPVWFPFELF